MNELYYDDGEIYLKEVKKNYSLYMKIDDVPTNIEFVMI